MAEPLGKSAKQATKAGLMSKHADEVEPIEPEDAVDEQTNENGEDDSIDDKLPRAGKHESEGTRKNEGLH